MMFVDAHPLASCDAGGNGRTVVMISNLTLAEDVVPIFQLYVNGSHRPDLDQFLVQPTKESWSTTSAIRFSTPAQPNLVRIHGEFTVKLTAMDSSGQVCEEMWDFKYYPHKQNKTEQTQVTVTGLDYKDIGDAGGACFMMNAV